MPVILADILQNIPDDPGIYKIVGRNPIDPIHGGEVCLYIGQSGRTKWEKPNSQGLQGRLARHLKNDAGELFYVVKNINIVSRIEYWVFDISKDSKLRNLIVGVANRLGKPAQEVFKEFLNAFEILMKSKEKIWHKTFLTRKQRKREKLDPILENELQKIYENEKQILEFRILDWLVKEEKEFRNSFKLLISDACREIFELRNYQSLNRHLSRLFKKWNAFKSLFKDSKPQNLYWTMFWIET